MISDDLRRDRLEESAYTYFPNGLRSTLGAYGQGDVLSAWDAADRQTLVTNARGKTATLTYDDAGKVIRRDYANGGYSTLDYDDAGNLTLVTNAGPGGANTSTLACSYDKANHKTLLTEGDGSTTRWSYDNASQLLNEQRTVAGVQTFSITYTWDQAGNRTLMQRTEGFATATTWRVLTIGVGGLHCPDL